MKIALCPIQSITGDVLSNISMHLDACRKAAHLGCQAAFFPELSITGYYLEEIKGMRFTGKEHEFQPFQDFSNQENMVIGIGAPLSSEKGTQIGLLVFHPNQPVQTYAKRWIHESEKPYFIPGHRSEVISVNNVKLAPAICYESKLEEHFSSTRDQHHFDAYLALVFKTEEDIAIAKKHYQYLAKKYNTPILCVNHNEAFQINQSPLLESVII
ncbi:MAG: carbon-nitrogen hydrolase family protein [Bacteroidota bacterium]